MVNGGVTRGAGAIWFGVGVGTGVWDQVYHLATPVGASGVKRSRPPSACR